MTTYPDYFSALLSNIEPDSTRLETAIQIVPQVREHLKAHLELTTIEPHTRLAGSYPRSTAIGNLKDVDTLVFVHKDYLEQKPSTVLYLLYNILEQLPDTIGGHVTVNLRKQRRSINVCFTDIDLYLDIVPVVMPTNIDEVLRVPDRGWEEWPETHPLGYQQFLSNLNKEHKGKVVPLVKLIKHWKDCHFVYKRPKSYWLECMVVRHIDKGWVKTDGFSYAQLFTSTLESIYTRYEGRLNQQVITPPHLHDPMLGNNVAWNWEADHFKTFMARVDESYRWAKRALELNNDQETDGVQLWQKVFRNTFPTLAEIRAKQAAEASRTGSLYVTSTGRPITSTSTKEQGIISPPHRFFGGIDE